MVKYTSILNDEAFKVFLTNPSNKDLLILLVEFLLPGKKIKTLTLDDKEQHVLSISDKNCTFDVYCTTDTKERLIIEMQFEAQASFQDRMLYYSTYPIRSQIIERSMKLKEGRPHKGRAKMDYRLDPVYVISFLNFQLRHDSGETLDDNGLVSRYEIRNGRSGELMTRALNFVFVELGRLKFGPDEKDKCRNLHEQLAFSLKYGHLLKERPEGFDDPLLRRLFDATDYAMMSDEQQQIINQIMTTEIDIIARRNYAIEQAMAKEKAEIAKNLLDLGLDIEIIKKGTGLSEEEIKAL